VQGVKGRGRRKRWGTAHGVSTALNIRGVPVGVRDSFKAFCAARGYTMADAVIALMRRAVDEDLALPGARRARKE